VITRLFLAATLLASGIAHAQVTCQTYLNTTNCNGSLAPSISPNQPTDWGAMINSAANAQAARKSSR
jgi:hypothetical protein